MQGELDSRTASKCFTACISGAVAARIPSYSVPAPTSAPLKQSLRPPLQDVQRTLRWPCSGVLFFTTDCLGPDVMSIADLKTKSYCHALPCVAKQAAA